MKTTIKISKNLATELKRTYPDESYDWIIEKLLDYYVTERKYLISSHGTAINLLFKFYPDDHTGEGKIEPYIKDDDEYIPLREYVPIRDDRLLDNFQNLMVTVLYSLPLSEQTEEKILNFNIGQSMTIGDDVEGYVITRVE